MEVEPTNAFVPFPRADVEQSIAARFEAIVRRYPERLAVKTRDQHCTYEALNRAANRVAHALLEARGAVAEPVPFLLDQSVSALAALYGILKAGKIAVPLHPALPYARLATILHDAQPGLLVTDRQQQALAETLATPQYQVLNLDTLAPSLSSDNPGLTLPADTLAYILYTSGSTGRPKGVMQTHRTILHDCMRLTNRLHFSAEDRMALFAALSTSQGMSSMFRIVLNGAALYPWPLKQEGLTHVAAWLMAEEITIYYSSASMFRAFIDTLSGTETFPALRLLRVGSEPVTVRDVEHYRACCTPDCLFLNALASTETMTVSACLLNHQTSLPDRIVPMGYALDDMEILLLDEHGAAVGPDQPGEIVIKSRYLSPGYWRQPDLTVAAFLPDPEGGEARLYRTGDLGRLLPDGCLVHLGRKDFRRMIRGYSVELHEVEQALRSHRAVKNVAVMAHPNHAGEQQLVAYVVPTQMPGPSIETLQDVVRQRLPEYMVPAAFVQLDALPLTPGGKVDRQQLPQPERTRPPLPHPYVAPRTPVETAVVRLWAETLGIERVGMHDAFLELGGDSLLAMRLAARVDAAFQVHVPLRTLLETSTVADMATVITQHLSNRLDNASIDGLLTGIERPSNA